MPIQTSQLLQTKLQRPRVPRHFVPRPRLFERLDQGSQVPLTLVCANAGYGKTTLVNSWLESLAAGNAATTPLPSGVFQSWGETYPECFAIQGHAARRFDKASG